MNAIQIDDQQSKVWYVIGFFYLKKHTHTHTSFFFFWDLRWILKYAIYYLFCTATTRFLDVSRWFLQPTRNSYAKLFSTFYMYVLINVVFDLKGASTIMQSSRAPTTTTTTMTASTVNAASRVMTSASVIATSSTTAAANPIYTSYDRFRECYCLIFVCSEFKTSVENVLITIW